MMDAPLAHLMADLRAAAEANGFATLVDTAAALESDAPGRLLLASAPGVATAPVSDWLASRGWAQTETLRLDRLASDPLAALVADKVMVVMRCGDLVDSAAAQTLQQAIFPRPLASYAVVLVEADRIATSEDLELVEFAARRALIAARDQPSAALADHHCFLWTADAVSSAVLQSRLEADRRLLEDWIRAPLAAPARQALDTWRAQVLVEQYAVAAAAATDDQAATADADAARRTRLLRASVSSIRERVLRRVDGFIEETEGHLVTSVDTLEQDALAGLAQVLPGWLDRAGGRLDQAFATNLGAYVRERERVWLEHADALVSAQRGRLVQDVENLLGGADWTLVNASLGPALDEAAYPGPLLQPLAWPGERRQRPSPAYAALELAPSAVTTPAHRRPLPVRVALPVVSGLFAGALGAYAGGWQVGLVVGAASAGAGLGAARHAEHSVALDQYRVAARAAIRDAFDQAPRQVRTRWRETVRPLREQVVAAFDQLEGDLARRSAARRESASTDRADLLQQAEALHARFVALGSTAAS